MPINPNHIEAEMIRTNTVCPKCGSKSTPIKEKIMGGTPKILSATTASTLDGGRISSQKSKKKILARKTNNIKTGPINRPLA